MESERRRTDRGERSDDVRFVFVRSRLPVRWLKLVEQLRAVEAGTGPWWEHMWESRAGEKDGWCVCDGKCVYAR